MSTKKSSSKEEYERIFNKLLGTEISWSKLPKEDLSQLALLFNNPEILLKKLSGGTFNELRSTIGDLVLTAAGKFDGPIMKAVREMVSGKLDGGG